MDLSTLTIHELQELIITRKVSAIEITNSVINKISEVEPLIEGYVSILQDSALKQAESIDNKLKNNEDVGLLAGIPVAVKDNICTENIKTTCSSKMLKDFTPSYNATVVDRLLQEDSIIIGKTNMDEFAMGATTETSYFKKTKNPHNLDCVPGGSSGGSAAVVASDEAVFSLGSDTGGSIRQPASFCGIVGFKPTYGLVSRYGMVAFGSSLDQIGPMTKDVTDCAIALNVISGYDKKDSTSVDIGKKDYTKALVNNVKGMKIGVPLEYMSDGTDEDIIRSMNQVLAILRGLGADYQEFSIPLTNYTLPTYYIISSAEASSNLARFDGVRYGYRTDNYNNIDELYANSRSEGFGSEVKKRIMLGTYALSSDNYENVYKKALRIRTLMIQDFNDAFEKYDVLITPVSTTTPWSFGNKPKDPLHMYKSSLCTASVNLAGLPAIVIPCGVDKDGLPIGVQIIGKHFDEERILQVAYTFEQNTDFHKMRPSIIK